MVLVSGQAFTNPQALKADKPGSAGPMHVKTQIVSSPGSNANTIFATMASETSQLLSGVLKNTCNGSRRGTLEAVFNPGF